MNKQYLVIVLIFVTCILVTSCNFLSCNSDFFGKKTDNQSQAPSTVSSNTLLQSNAVSNTPNAAVGTPAPASKTEQYNTDPSGNKWTFSNSNFSVVINKIYDSTLGLTYLLADINIKNDDVIQSGFSDPTSPGSSPTDPSAIALAYNAVYAQNGDYFSWPKNSKGIVIRNGIVLYNQQQLADTLAFIPDGTLKAYKPGEATAQQLLNEGVKNALSFGPILVNNGVINPDMNQSKVHTPNTRSGFGMVSKNHFIGIVTEGTGIDGSHSITLDDFSKLFLTYKCTVAYNFDGGQSATMIFMGKPINTHLEANGILFRKLPDILIIGTSETVSKLNNGIG